MQASAILGSLQELWTHSNICTIFFLSNVHVSVLSVGQIYIVREDIDCSRMSYKRSIFKAKLVCKFDSSVGELTLETVVCDEAS